MPTDHPTETFRALPGNPGYRVGDLGTVQSCRRRGPARGLGDEWRDLKQTTKDGYLVVGISDGTGTGQRLVHRLVLESFDGPCPPGMECRHLDGDRANNRLSNLAWGTAVENAGDRDLHGHTARRPGERHHNVKLTAPQVVEIRRRVAAGEPHRMLAAEFHVAASTVRNIASRHRWKHVPT